MDIVPVKFNISEQEYTQSKGSVREMLLEKGFRPRSEMQKRVHERRVYPLEEVRALRLRCAPSLQRHLVQSCVHCACAA